MSENWWRAKNSAVNNRKLQKLPGDLFKAWFNVNCLASANDGVVPPLEDVSFALRTTDQKAAVILTQLTTAKLLDRRGDGTFVPHDWDQHQFKTDKTDPTAAKRAKEYRDRKRNERDASRVTERDGTVTDKRPEAEADSETEQSRADAGAPALDVLKRDAEALAVAITAVFQSRQVPVPQNMDRCHSWLLNGYSKGAVLAAVEKVLKRGSKPATLEYFDGAIIDWSRSSQLPQPSLQVVPSNKVWVDEGTLEWNCWQRVSNNGRGSPVCDQRDTDGRLTGRRGWEFPSLMPPGFNDFGERIDPTEERVA